MGRDVGEIESGSVEGLWRWECGGIGVWRYRSVEGCIGTGWKCRRVQAWKDAGGSVEGCRCGGGSVEGCRCGGGSVEECRYGGGSVQVWRNAGGRSVEGYRHGGEMQRGAGVEYIWKCGGMQVWRGAGMKVEV